MGKGQKPGWTFLIGIVIQLCFVLATSEVAFRKDGVDPNYASLLKECKKIKLPNGTMIQTVPKLLETPLVTACSTWKSKYGPPLRQAVCRFPDCLSNPCQYGWCEETLQGYQCLCFPGFRGEQCAERWTLPTDGTTVSSSESSQSATSPTSTSASTAPADATTITPSESTLSGTSATSTSGSPLTTESSGTVDTSTISKSDPESPSTPTSTESMAATDSTTVTPLDSTLESTFPASTSASTAPTDATTITPSDPTLQTTSPTSTSSPTTTSVLSASANARTMSPSDSTLPATSPTSTSAPPTTTGSTTPTDTTAITPSDSTLSITSSTLTSRPPTTGGSSAKVFVTNPDAIFISFLRDELSFTSIPSTSDPNYIKYDPTEKHIYWSDYDDRCVYRANLHGTDREQVTAAEAYRPYGTAIAERSRILYIAYIFAHKVTSMSIELGSPLPGTESDFVNQGIFRPRALIINEEEGFLYISRDYGIVRALLNATNDIEQIYHNSDLTALTGLSIDLTRNPQRIFFCDVVKKRTFYKDLTRGANSDTSTAVELTAFLHNPYQESLVDVSFYNGILYWLKQNPHGIGIMTDYDQTNRSYRVHEISQFQIPWGMLIISIEP